MKKAPFLTVIILSIVLIFLSPASLFAKTVYAKKNKTKITEAPSPKSKTITLINPDTPLLVMNKKGKFLYVKLPNGKKGWVFKFKVMNKKPAQEKGDGDLFALLAGERTIKADEASTGGSIRGLNKVSEKYAKGEGINPEHIQAVKNMENFKVSSKKLDIFMSEGRLGEYAKIE